MMRYRIVAAAIVATLTASDASAYVVTHIWRSGRSGSSHSSILMDCRPMNDSSYICRRRVYGEQKIAPVFKCYTATRSHIARSYCGDGGGGFNVPLNASGPHPRDER